MTHSASLVRTCSWQTWRFIAGLVDASGAFTLTTPVSTAAIGSITPGATRHFQAWTRDVLCGPPPSPCVTPCNGGSNLSNAYHVTFVP